MTCRYGVPHACFGGAIFAVLLAHSECDPGIPGGTPKHVEARWLDQGCSINAAGHYYENTYDTHVEMFQKDCKLFATPPGQQVGVAIGNTLNIAGKAGHIDSNGNIRFSGGVTWEKLKPPTTQNPCTTAPPTPAPPVPTSMPTNAPFYWWFHGMNATAHFFNNVNNSVVNGLKHLGEQVQHFSHDAETEANNNNQWIVPAGIATAGVAVAGATIGGAVAAGNAIANAHKTTTTAEHIKILAPPPSHIKSQFRQVEANPIQGSSVHWENVPRMWLVSILVAVAVCCCICVMCSAAGVYLAQVSGKTSSRTISRMEKEEEDDDDVEQADSEDPSRESSYGAFDEADEAE